eukprot:1694802-Pyramimonas_sp.AAC.1
MMTVPTVMMTTKTTMMILMCSSCPRRILSQKGSRRPMCHSTTPYACNIEQEANAIPPHAMNVHSNLHQGWQNVRLSSSHPRTHASSLS